MEMKASEDIAVGEDMTPPLFPLSFSLHDSFLHTHCSSCFSPLLSPPSPSPSLLPLYCSALCSSSGSPLHFSSAESHLLPSSSLLRAALRLLHSLTYLSPSRIFGLLTNRHHLISERDEMSALVRNGARAMVAARRLRGGNENEIESENEDDDVFLEEEAALCAVLTNAVEVQDKEGRNLGIAVYDVNFSWINHSCSPNACYRFLISPPGGPLDTADSRLLRIVPAGSSGEKCVHSNAELTKGYGGYGPKIIVRSIKRIKKSEEVTVAYTDLLQPKAIRQSELWSKYHFICCCIRCNASPPSYVDHILQEIIASDPACSSLSSDSSFCRDEATEKLTDLVDEVVTEYLSVGDPKSCCKKLEGILMFGLLNEPLEAKEGKSQLNVKLHPLHHLALNAYMTLASAYRTYASESLAFCSEIDGDQLEVFNMFRSGAAYSFLLAAATQHLFYSDRSLVVSLANFWTNSGESLLTLARSSVWGLFGKWDLAGSELISLNKHKCLNCSLLDRFEANLSLGQVLNEDFENMSSEFLDCITRFSHEVWSFLTQGSHYLKMFKDPTGFSSLGKLSNISGLEANLGRNHMNWNWTGKSTSRIEAQEYKKLKRRHIFQLGVHCLLYGEILGSICYGRDSHRTKHVQCLLYYDYEDA